MTKERKKKPLFKLINTTDGI
jgi:hypothetical protein